MKVDGVDRMSLLTVSEAARMMRVSRATIAAAMDEWTASRGHVGLRWVQPRSRRLVRVAALTEWCAAMERVASFQS